MALLQVENLTKRFGETTAVDGVSFAIGEGRCVALLGPNGAGKTTTIRMLTGLLAPSSGAIAFDGMQPGEDVRALIGYLPQTPPAYGWMTGLEFLVHCGKLCGLTAKEAAEAAERLLARVGLAGAGKRRVAGYSGGMKQRLGIAQALVHRPRLLVLDEPVSALDPVGRRETMELLRELKRETTVLFSTHVLPDAEALCDDIVIMASGKVAVSGELAEVRRRHRKPVIEVRTDGSRGSGAWVRAWAEAMRAKGVVLEAEPVPDGLRLTVGDVDAARRELLGGLAAADIGVRKLEIGYSSLEDLFMKAVTAS